MSGDLRACVVEKGTQTDALTWTLVALIPEHGGQVLGHLRHLADCDRHLPLGGVAAAGLHGKT